MTEHEQMTETATETVVKARLHAAASGIRLPDIWTGVAPRVTGTGQRGRSRFVGWPVPHRWLAPTGTALFVAAVALAWVMFINSDESQPATEGQVGSEASNPNGETGETQVSATLLEDMVALLENAGPFRVEGELFTSSRQGGRVSWMPLNPSPAQFDSEAFHSILLTGHYDEQECVEHGADRVCLLVFSPKPPVDCGAEPERYQVCGGFEVGEPFAINQVVGGTYGYDSVFWNPDQYLLERRLTIDPQFTTRVNGWLFEIIEWRTPDRKFLEDFTRIVTLRQGDGRFFDSSSPATGGYGTIVEGSADSFLALHLNPFGTTQLPADISQELQLEDIQQVSSADANGSNHYRATIAGGVGETGTFEMWTRTDGLPLRIEIEAFSPPGGARHDSGETEVTRIQLNFTNYGVPVEPAAPALRAR